MALSSTMVSPGLYERICEGVCVHLSCVCAALTFLTCMQYRPNSYTDSNFSFCYFLRTSPFTAILSTHLFAFQSFLPWTWTPWWAPSVRGWTTQWSLRSPMASITPWIRRLSQSLTIRMRRLASLLLRAFCFTPTGENAWPSRTLWRVSRCKRNGTGEPLNLISLLADLWSTCWTNVTFFPSRMKNAKRGGGKCCNVHTGVYTLGCFFLFFCFPFFNSCVGLCSSRNYTVPDPPGLFDGHVWPMYLKHKHIMESSDVDVGWCIFGLIPKFSFTEFPLLI